MAHHNMTTVSSKTDEYKIVYSTLFLRIGKEEKGDPAKEQRNKQRTE